MAFLKFIEYKDLKLWDVKRYSAKEITSKFPMVSLNNHIQAEHKKYKLFLEPENDFGILDMNNVEGIFDAYTQKGKEINQAYKKMQTGWIAYNPYRINVGSIGIKKDEHKNEYISPAYVVFSCKENLLPEFLFLVFKTKTFNQVINDNTTGSVRQNLTIDILKSLQIPLPTLFEQQKIVKSYFAKINRAKELEKENEEIRKNLELVLFAETKEEPKQKKDTRLKFVEFAKMSNWSVSALLDINFNYSIQFPLLRIGDFLIRNREIINIDGETIYKRVKVKINSNGVVLRDTEKGVNIGTKKQYLAKTGQFIVSKIDARNGAFGIIPNELNNAIVTNDFPLFDVDTTKINPHFLPFVTTTKEFIKFAQSCSSGTTNRQRMDINMFLDQKIPLPPLYEQQKLIGNYFENIKEITFLKHQAETEFEQTVFL